MQGKNITRGEIMVSLRDWLIDLAENNRWDIVDGEVVILPIKESEE